MQINLSISLITIQFILQLVHLVAGFHCVYVIKLTEFYYSVTYTEKNYSIKMQTVLESPCMHIFPVGLLTNSIVENPILKTGNNLGKLQFLHCESHTR